jgi:hypothetical protein
LRTVGLSALTADPTDPVRAVARDRASIDHICVPARVAHEGSPRLEVCLQALLRIVVSAITAQ